MGERLLVYISVGDFVNGPCESVQVHVADEERHKVVLHRLYTIDDDVAERETIEEVSRLIRKAIAEETRRHERRKG